MKPSAVRATSVRWKSAFPSYRRPSPNMLRLAGQIADGVITNLLSPEYIPRSVEILVRESAKEAGRDPGVGRDRRRIFLCASEDREGALEVAKRSRRLYGTGRTRTSSNCCSLRRKSCSPCWT
ncbi:MAG: LLM class flavin-dependent oxidoreductase [Dehalococcoidia bacterium]|nr:LLM class flavin-dependent oxidoreductase [Dehalococcoidia bacterium]